MHQDATGIAPLEVGTKKAVGIIEIGKDQIESTDVIHPVGIENGTGHEKGAERTVIHRTGRIEVVTLQGNLGEARVAKQLDVRIGPLLAQKTHRGQGDNEIAQGAAANE